MKSEVKDIDFEIFQEKMLHEYMQFFMALITIYINLIYFYKYTHNRNKIK